MAIASAARHDISFVPESTFGVTPASPAMKLLRHTGTTLGLAKAGVRSQERYADGQVRDIRHGHRRIQGNIDIELSYGAHDDWLAALLGGAWATNVLKRGILIPSFTVERRFNDIGQFLRHRGVTATSGSIAITPGNDGALVTGSLTVLGKDMDDPAATQLGAPTDVATHPPFDTWSGVVTEGGQQLGVLTSLTLDINNGFSPAYVVGSAVTPEIIPGNRTVTGNASVYFTNATMLQKFISETESSIAVTLDGPAGGDLKIELPRIKYTGGELPVSGDGALTLNMPFEALRDPATATSIMLTRTPA